MAQNSMFIWNIEEDTMVSTTLMVDK